MLNKILTYFYDSWVRTTGKEWTGKQVLVSYIFSVLFAGAIVLYSFIANLHWSWIQILAAALISWDLGGGVLGYNHKAIKIRQAGEKSTLHFFHHNLQHIHPLMLIFFNNGPMLLGLSIYWFVSFFLYVEFLEINPETGKRKLSKSGEKIVIAFEIVLAAVLVTLSFVMNNVSPDHRTFGLIVYGALPVLTLILINIPVSFQRTFSMLLVVSMIAISMYMPVPPGFSWLIPVYFLKLLTGFTAKEEVLSPVC
ncbi:MAG: hypothetical protein GY754_34785 [bacterium]|nr:hypothetical protein [bacterium]